ncbi:transposase [Chryseobacterium sp.]|uniref:transposase n=1 Tax=Chryseobacterium sp. TaxID=1871047 RepID=UPI002898AC35|nr:transposase [Chryseobacterium sp.]
MGDNRITSLEPERYYHIYNRGINGETIFKSDRNKDFFLQKITQLLIPVCDIYCYCLLSNHFHLLVRIKSDAEINSLVKVQNLDKAFSEKGLHSYQNVFSKQFSRIFNSYSQAFNKENSRHGALIESPFRRKEITSEEYLRNTIVYIHQNPQLHNMSDDFRTFKYSSYQTILSNKSTSILRKEVIKLFDDEGNFIFCHQKMVDELDF